MKMFLLPLSEFAIECVRAEAMGMFQSHSKHSLILESLGANQSRRSIEELLSFIRLRGENSYFIKTRNKPE